MLSPWAESQAVCADGVSANGRQKQSPARKPGSRSPRRASASSSIPNPVPWHHLVAHLSWSHSHKVFKKRMFRVVAPDAHHPRSTAEPPPLATRRNPGHRRRFRASRAAQPQHRCVPAIQRRGGEGAASALRRHCSADRRYCAGKSVSGIRRGPRKPSPARDALTGQSSAMPGRRRCPAEPMAQAVASRRAPCAGRGNAWCLRRDCRRR
jgi:hypothetical protein